MRLLNFRTPAATLGLALLIGAFALPTNTSVAQQTDDVYRTDDVYQSPPPRKRRKVCERYVGKDGQVRVRCYYK